VSEEAGKLKLLARGLELGGKCSAHCRNCFHIQASSPGSPAKFSTQSSLFQMFTWIKASVEGLLIAPFIRYSLESIYFFPRRESDTL
jgi:hypothetical protein